MADTIKRTCPSCGGAFYLNGGVARCPHCGQTVSAGGARVLRGQPQHPQQQATPSISRSQFDSLAAETRTLIRQQLTANHQYWAAEAQAIEAEFGMIPAWLGELLR